MAVEVNNDNIDEMLGNNQIVLIDFWAPWCGPCRMLGPIIEELSNDNTDIIIGKLNVDENGETASRYGVRGIPAMIFFKNGEIVEKMIGVKAKGVIQDKLDEIKMLN